MKSDCLYFTRFTVDSEGSYYPFSPALIERFLVEAPRIPEVVAIAELCRERLGIDAFAEIRRGPHKDKPFLSKTVQAIFFISLAHYLARECRQPISGAGFYSGGVIPAYLFAGAFTIEEYLTSISAFVNEYYRQRDEKGAEYELSQALLCGDFTDDVVAFVEAYIRDTGLGAELFVKDRRQAHMVLVAGLTPAVERVREAALGAFPKLAASGAKLQRVNAAHLPLIDRRRILPLLDGASLHPPRITLIGTRGQVVPAGCTDADLLRSVFIEAITGTMNTGESIECIARDYAKLIAIGSPHSLRVLDGISPHVLPPIVIASADLLDGAAA